MVLFGRPRRPVPFAAVRTPRTGGIILPGRPTKALPRRPVLRSVAGIMAMQEFYIRAANESEARGPFNQEQLVTLAGNGQIDAATLFYDAVSEQWVAFGTNPELMALVFPEKQKLRLGRKEIKSLNEEGDSAPPISVDDMLAAAEGLTSETKDKHSLVIDQARCAKLGLWAALLALAFSAAGLCLPSITELSNFDFATILLKQPLALLGLLDAGLTLMLLLQAISIYPFVRFRAMLGLGLIGFMLWAQGLIGPIVPLLAGSVGLYFCTICISSVGVGLAALGALGGMAGFAWFMLH